MESLVLAISRDEIGDVRGFSRAVSLDMLEAIRARAWFSEATTLASDETAKELRIALLIRRGGQFLVDESGILLHGAPVRPAVAGFGEGLRALRELARAAGGELLGRCDVAVQLYGFLNDETLAETRSYFVIVYAIDSPADSPAPAASCWVGLGQLARLPLDPASRLLVEALNDAG